MPTAPACAYDKIVARSTQVEIDNRVPTDDQPQNKAYQPPAPSDVATKRRLNASKGGKQA
ncbi:hypothetical protein P4050_00515 [Pseudomonas aeruginosa]|nr:hypothetical protein [Pseudomonas aeruginosa]